MAFGRKITWIFDPMLSFHVGSSQEDVQGAPFQAHLTNYRFSLRVTLDE